tara:strand:+ start:502 stop:690 length:189 start_codon:yes stop_codon:yes gene_type:complete
MYPALDVRRSMTLTTELGKVNKCGLVVNHALLLIVIAVMRSHTTQKVWQVSVILATGLTQNK